MNDFTGMGLSERTLATLRKKGFETPTEIQTLAIPLLMENKKDIIAQAQTGTGKTAVFALPLIEKLDPQQNDVQAMILAPTRELVIQVCEEIDSLKGDSGLRTAPIYGGQQINLQLRKLKRGVHIAVGTPGRVLDHIRRGTLRLDRIKYFILDEADEMLNMGFIEDIEEVMKETPEEKRILLFSATMPGRIKKLAENYMGEYTHVRSEPELTTDLTEQIYFEVRVRDKLDALIRILQIETEFYGIVFCKTKADVDDLTNKLMDNGFRADNLHGDISQPLREKILGKFRTKKINILVATDVAARGIDVDDLTHVINYSIPNNPEVYVHRIGRTGRRGRKGTALTFVTPSELRKMNFIKKFTKAEITKQRPPQEHEMVEIKKKRLESDIEKMITQKEIDDFRVWAKELLEESSSEDLISALLKYSFGKDPMKSQEKWQTRDRRVTDWKRDDEKPSDRRRDDRGFQDQERNDRAFQNRRRDDRIALDHRRDEPRDQKREEPREFREDPVPMIENLKLTRLSIAMGKKDRMNKRRIIEMINHKAGTRPEKITNVEILEEVSYVSVPSKDAKSILKFFRRTMMGKKPLVSKVQENPKGGPRGKKEGHPKARKEKGRFVRP